LPFFICISSVSLRPFYHSRRLFAIIPQYLKMA